MVVVAIYQDGYRITLKDIISMYYFSHYLLFCRVFEDYKIYYTTHDHGDLEDLVVYSNGK